MKTIYGQILDADGKPLEFGTVYVSDDKGNIKMPNRSVTTSENGSYKLDGVNDDDYITSRYVGFDPKTIAVSKTVDIPILIGKKLVKVPSLIFNMVQGAGAQLATVEVSSPKYVPPKAKKDYTFLIIGLLGLLTIAGVIAYKTKTA